MPKTAKITSKAKRRLGALLGQSNTGKAVAGLGKLQKEIQVRARGKAKLSDAEIRAAIEDGRL